VTYTSNWPSEPLVGNTPTTPTFIWTSSASCSCSAGLARSPGTTRRRTARSRTGGARQRPAQEPHAHALDEGDGEVLLGSHRADRGADRPRGITAHYAVEGQAFYGFPLAEYLPYSVARSWHLQLAVLWIATAWLATGLYIAPRSPGTSRSSSASA